jgi:hypothetical protein
MQQQEAPTPAIDWGRLRSPVPKESLQVRPGARSKDGSQALIIAYIDADYVADTLDTVVGPGNWRTECQEITDAGVIAVRRSIAIRVGEEWIEKWDYGLRHEAARWIVMRSRTRHDRVSHHPYPTRKIESPRTTYPIPIAGSIRTVRGRCGCQHQAAWGQGGRHGQHM